MKDARIPAVSLNDGRTLPAIGLGTYNLRGSAGVASIISAVKAGYRLLDSAFNYENEGVLGEAVRRCGVAREELFLTSKLPGRRQRYEQALETVEESLYRAGLSYYDLYLIHWPNPRQGLYVEAWRALIEAQKRGLLRSIGVCNFLPEHIETLSRETGVTPAVNQVELHPFFQQAGQLAFDKAHGVVTQSWSPLARASRVFENPTLSSLAKKRGKTVSQIVLRWHVELGALPIPKAASLERQMENLSIFDFSLTEEDMAAIGGLDEAGGRLQGQDPATYEEF